MITRAHVMPYLGQHVFVRTGDGAMHHGILHSVTDDGIYLRPLQGRTGLVSGAVAPDVQLIQPTLPDDIDAERTWWPFLFFPWWWIGGFGPWGWGW